MHETHLIEPVIRGINMHAQKEGAKRISTVRLKVGMLTAAKEDSLRETFNILAQGTLLEGAALEITFFPCSRVEVVSFDIE